MSNETGIEWIKGHPEEFREALRDPELFAGPVRTFLTRVVIHIQRLARGNAPVDTGALRQSITYNVDKAQMPQWGKVGTNKSHAPDMEYGTNALSEKPSLTGNRPWPTGAELDTWARRHDLNPYAVANAIKNRGGLRARRYLRRAMKEARTKVRQELGVLARAIQRKWGN